MRILRIDGWEGPTAGGAEVYIGRVSRALTERGHPNLTAALVTEDPGDLLGPSRVFRIPHSPRVQLVSGVLDSHRLVGWLDEVASEFRPDVIHLHHFRLGYLALGPWLARRPEPIVFTVHDVERLCPIATLTLPDGARCPGGVLLRCQFTGCGVGLDLPYRMAERRYFDRYVQHRVQKYICVSKATRRAFESLGYRPTELLRPMIPVPPVPAPVPKGPFTVGLFGRLERQKGIEVLLRAVDLVRRTHPEVRVRIGGSGPFTLPQDPNLLVDGWVTDTSGWFGSVHALIVPSLGWENLGNSPIEALGHGLPVIVSDAGGLPETVGEFGTVVAKGDVEALADAIRELVDHYDEYRARAEIGRKWVRREFSVEHHLAQLLRIYDSASRSGPA